MKTRARFARYRGEGRLQEVKILFSPEEKRGRRESVIRFFETNASACAEFVFCGVLGDVNHSPTVVFFEDSEHFRIAAHINFFAARHHVRIAIRCSELGLDIGRGARGEKSCRSGS